jgi:Rrf2 family protein
MFTKATEYALRATIYIAQKGSEVAKLGIDEIAVAIDSPRSFTAKVLQLLSRDNHIISSVRGPNGGFYLTEKAKSLPISCIIQAMGEEEMLEKCVLGLKQCSETQPCPMHLQFKPIRKQLKDMFINKTIREFAAEIKDGVIFICNR